jgi:hypothetical protein
VTQGAASASFKTAFTLMGHVNRIAIETGVRLGRPAEVGTPLRADPDPY